MPSTVRKLCLVGEPGVGKTALVRHLLASAGGEDFDASNAGRGIRLAACDLGDAAEARPVMLWDVGGYSALDSLNQAFLSGIDGIAAVADASRPSSAASALRLIAQIRRLYPGTPAVLMLNKRDLATPFAVPVDPAADVEVFDVSARAGDNVREAFAALERRVRERA